LPLQTWQVAPVPPQSLFDVPSTQTWVAVQQPEAHEPHESVPPHPSAMIPQADPQDTLVHPQTPAVPPPPQVAGEVQSVFAVHPHPPPTHAVPAEELVHTAQVPPATPQVAGCVSAVWQLVPSQQAALHASPPLQLVLHVFDVVEQASPAGQSAAAPHPHTPPS
jgi:hypothetical protein